MVSRAESANSAMSTVATTTGEPRPILSDEMLGRFERRAPEYDEENRFCTEDFEELRDAGYLTMAVPAELGGRGYTLAQVCSEQRRLGYHAPATALG